MILQNVGTAQLPMSSTLIADDDTRNQVTTLYFDIDVTLGGDWNPTNKLFYETYELERECLWLFSVSALG